MNIFHIIIAKVSATITVILISFGLVSAPVVQVPVATSTPAFVTGTSTTADCFENSCFPHKETTVTLELLKPAVTSNPTVITAPVEVATSSPVVVPVTVLPTTNEVAPTPAPQTVIIQIQQPEAPVASAPQTMEKLYQLTKGEGESESIVLDNVTEQEIRDFTEKLDDHITWRKQSQSALFTALKQALKANGYNVIEK